MRVSAPKVRTTAWFGLVLPTSVTEAASVLRSPTVPVSEAGSSPRLLATGACVSSVKSRPAACETLPAASTARASTCTAPSARSLPPLSARSTSAPSSTLPSPRRLKATGWKAPAAPRRSCTACTAPASTIDSSSEASRVSRSTPEAPLSLASASVTTGATASGSVVDTDGSVAGSSLTLLMLAVAGSAGTTSRLLPRIWPPTESSLRRCAAPPSWRSSPSPNTPSTGSRLTRMRLSTRSPPTRSRPSVPARKASALAPLPPKAASSPRSAPTSSVKPRAEPPICTTCTAAAESWPAASPWVENCSSEPAMLACQPARVLPTAMALARPCTLHRPETAPATCRLPST